MKGLFNYDSWILQFLAKMADLLILNLVAILFCLPIVTIGATITATHYTALKIRRGEGYVIKNFFKSFKTNFKQSTIMWLVFAGYTIIAVLALSIIQASNTIMSLIIQVIIIVSLGFTIFVALWTFPLQSWFVNTISVTFKNALFMSFKYFWRTLYMLLCCASPVALLFARFSVWQGFLFMIGFSVPVYWCAMIYDRIFEELEDRVRAESV